MLKVSVITVCYNAVSTIEETMLSVLNQTYTNIEYIIIDGGSTDGTVDIIKKYADRLAYWVSEPDKGIYDAMNKGIAVATGEYINFMNAGDMFYNEGTISEVIEQTNCDYDIVYGDNISILKHSKYRKKAGLASNLSKGMPFCHQSAFIKTRFHQQHPFITSFKSAGDYKFFYDAFFVYNVKFQYRPAIVSIYDSKSGASKDDYWLTHKEYLLIRNESDSFNKRVHIIYNRLKYHIKNNLPQCVISLIK